MMARHVHLCLWCYTSGPHRGDHECLCGVTWKNK
jgi:hypothetical protein